MRDVIGGNGVLNGIEIREVVRQYSEETTCLALVQELIRDDWGLVQDHKTYSGGEELFNKVIAAKAEA